ncbi:Glyoxylate/hydroxypyruvate reductase B [Stratiformator vulcanicus]|uniref:Glyoxylate/hydroxypyruvate reductase B n=2 Tax=Stratiformator vulcanicus TaxID=2527980 RepID=A0A517R2M8_9PLAN|nr:Glyoxylate/hydroxypyruvate reductase B [Stratiformator vulcanicus]
MAEDSKRRVFVSRRIPENGLERLRTLCDVDIWEGDLPPDRETLCTRAAGCHGVLSMLSDAIDPDFMDRVGPQLQVVSNYAVGFNNIDVEEATRRGIRVGNTPGVLTDATADIAFALLINCARRISESERSVHDGKWKTWEPLGFIGLDLVGKTIGIVGLGRIGQAMARRCHGGWGMDVLYTSRSSKPEAEGEFDADYVSMDELLTRSDFISVHCDLNNSTSGLFDASAFQKMKSTAVFINTARGSIHNQNDLAAALTNGEIAAAGLDVTDPEPIPADDPLLDLQNCVVIPHIGSATVDTRAAMADIAAENVLRALADEPMPHCVNPPS